MIAEAQRTSTGATVRIWRDSKKRLAKVIEKRSEKEERNISEAEMVSKAVNQFCTKEEKKLGIV